ncbi:MAG: TIGR00645 family protein [Candidatus Nanopelagicales bacterium]|nr:TIGR00645 family protein [Candidatus Nanopelagicales bacterium]
MTKKNPAHGGGLVGKFKSFEHGVEVLLFNGRWLLMPFYIGLLLGLVVLVVKFAQEFWHLLSITADASLKDTTISLLELLDIVLLANLIIIVIFSGYENFVSKIAVAKKNEDRPSWMGKVDFSGLKIKLIGSLVAISVIQLLAVFLEPEMTDTDQIFWMIAIHLTFVVSGVLFAVMDYIADKRATIDIAAEKAALELRILEKEHGFHPGYAESLDPQGE